MSKCQKYKKRQTIKHIRRPSPSGRACWSLSFLLPEETAHVGKDFRDLNRSFPSTGTGNLGQSTGNLGFRTGWYRESGPRYREPGPRYREPGFWYRESGLFPPTGTGNLACFPPLVPGTWLFPPLVPGTRATSAFSSLGPRALTPPPRATPFGSLPLPNRSFNRFF